MTMNVRAPTNMTERTPAINELKKGYLEDVPPMEPFEESVDSWLTLGALEGYCETKMGQPVAACRMGYRQ